MFYRCWLSVWSHVLSFVYPKIKYTNIFWQTPGSNGESNETPANSYTSVKTLMENPCGHRIDYIFYQSSQAYKVRFAEETILYCNFCISVLSVVSIKKKSTNTGTYTHGNMHTVWVYTSEHTLLWFCTYMNSSPWQSLHGLWYYTLPSLLLFLLCPE